MTETVAAKDAVVKVDGLTRTSSSNSLTDLLLRLDYHFDYLDADVLAEADIAGNTLRVGEEAHELLILPPMAHIKLSTLEKLEQFVAQLDTTGRVRVLSSCPIPHGTHRLPDRFQTRYEYKLHREVIEIR